MGTSGKEVGQQYLHVFSEYLGRTPQLPTTEGGLLNVAEIAEKSGIPRQSFYKNPKIRAALEEARLTRGVQNRKSQDAARTAAEPPRGDEAAVKSGDKKTKTLERRVTQLEQQNAALVAENAELRRQLKALRLQAGREDMIIETGRRIPAPPAHG